jgi:Tol biopolymer transport system component
MTELIPDVHSPVTFSPDGAQIAFIRRVDEPRQTSIVLADADGKNQRTLLTRTWPQAFSTLGLAWSPDGKTLAVATKEVDGQDELVAVNIVDGDVKRIGERAWGVAGNLAWLPDGKAVVLLARQNAVARKSYVWRVPYPAGEAKKITDDVSLYLTNSLSVSSDGRLAVLQGFIHSAIWVAPRGDVKRARRVLQGIAPRYEGVDGLAWTADRRLLYTAYTGDNLSIWSMASDGGQLRHLTRSDPGVVDTQMCVTADGRYMVFQSNRSRALEIWRANTDGTRLTQLTTGGGNSLPSLSADGRWVVYTSTRHGRATLWRIGIDGGKAVQVTDRPSSWPQVSPDGTRIAHTAPADSTDARLTIIPFEHGSPLKSFPVPRSGLIGRRVMRWTPDGSAIIYKDDMRGLWRQGLDQAQPQLVHGFEELTVQHLAWSFDGKDLAYTSGLTTQEIILIDQGK